MRVELYIRAPELTTQQLRHRIKSRLTAHGLAAEVEVGQMPGHHAVGLQFDHADVGTVSAAAHLAELLLMSMTDKGWFDAGMVVAVDARF